MKKTIDNIASWLVGLTERKDNIDRSTTAFMKRGNNALVVSSIILGILFTFLSFDLYKSYGKLWLALIPIVFFVFAIFGVLLMDSYRSKLKKRNRSSSMKLVGFNMDFNERILRKIYGSLTKYEFLDENLTTFKHFHNVMVLDFDKHESVLHFSCTQAELKYILEKFKRFKKGLHLSTFERSEKVYNNGNLISAKSLYKNYSENPPTPQFEKLIDSFFDFLGEI